MEIPQARIPQHSAWGGNAHHDANPHRLRFEVEITSGCAPFPTGFFTLVYDQ